MATIEQLIQDNECLQLVRNTNGKQRIHCTLTKRDILPNVPELEAHLISKAFKKAQWYAHDYSKYEPFIVPHKSNPKRLYCNVTSTTLNRIPEQIERHVQGKRFKRLKADVTTTKTSSDLETHTAVFHADSFEFANSHLIASEDDDGLEHCDNKKEDDSHLTDSDQAE